MFLPAEAILGAAYETGHAEGGLRSGFDHALAAALALKVKIPGVATWEDMSRLHGPIPESGLVAEQPTSLEETLGYRFKRSHLLQEALTHPSKIGIASQQTLERFEWLGDSVLVRFFHFQASNDQLTHLMRTGLPRREVLLDEVGTFDAWSLDRVER